MALTDIIKKIAEDADREAAAIVSEAKERAREIDADSARAVTVLEEEAAHTQKRASERAAEHVLASARYQANFTRAETRSQCVQEVFDEVAKKLTSLSPAEYTSLMKKLLKDAPKKGSFLVAKERENETKKLIKELGFSGDVTVAKEGELLGGLIASTEENEFDFSFSGMLRELEKDARARVAQELFN